MSFRRSTQHRGRLHVHTHTDRHFLRACLLNIQGDYSIANISNVGRVFYVYNPPHFILNIETM
jgi:hypothetical protein